MFEKSVKIVYNIWCIISERSELMSKIKIALDSPGDLSIEIAEKNGISILPIKFSLEDEEELIRDKIDITDDEFYKKIRETGIIPKTVQITPIEFEEFYLSFADEYDEIIMITISANGSGTHRNAVMAAEEVKEKIKVHVVDSNLYSYCYGLMALKAKELADAGKCAEEIVKVIEKQRDNTVAFFSVETLDYLKKGGRISTMSAIIGGVLDIRPILTVTQDGKVAAIEKTKGEKKMLLKMRDLTKETLADCDYELYWLYSDRKDNVEKLVAMLENEGFKFNGSAQVGAVIGSHAGPGVFAVVMIKK